MSEPTIEKPDDDEPREQDPHLQTGASEVAEPALAPDLVELILQQATDGGVPPSELTAHPSVVSMLSPAAVLAASLLVHHGRNCPRPRACRDTPPPLRNYLTMKEATVAGQVIPIARALIDYPGYTFTEYTRNAWLKNITDEVRDEAGEPTLIEQIEDGSLFSAEGLRDFLGDQRQSNAQRLGTTLWARQFPVARERELFRYLAPLARDDERDRAPVPIEPATRRPDRKTRRDERREIQEAEKEIRDLKRERRRLKEEVTRESQSRAAVASSLAESERERDLLRAEVARLEGDLRQATGRVAITERERERATSGSEKLRESLDAARETRVELEQARNRAVRELSVRNRQAESLRAQIAASPAGTDAVHAFLAAEEARIKEDLMILQGGDHRRAEAEHATHRKLEQAFRAAYPAYVPPRPAIVVKPAELLLDALGGSDEVGRSAYLLRLDNYSVLVDCGIKIGKKHLDETAPALERVDQLDAVILTHAHTDHLGWLPAVVHRFPDVSIYCTTETAELAPIMLDDCHRHHLVNMERLRRESQHAANSVAIEDPYEREDVLGVDVRLMGCEFDEPVTLPSSDIQIRFFPAGHILGAASVLIEGEGRRILMSGDISAEAQLTVGSADWQGCEGDLDLLVLESTYGDATREPLAQAQEELVSFVQRALAEGGSVILPCFGLGRGQEVAMLLANAMSSGHLPNATVWIDGMIRSINAVYREYQPQFRLPDNFVEVEGAYERMDVVAEAKRQPTLIVTTSGMLAGGPAVEYAEKLLPDAKNRIAFTGYQDEGNPGHELLRLTQGGTGVRTISIPNEEGQPVQIRAAAPAKKFGLSAHADQKGLLDYARSVRPSHVFLVHGFERTQKPLRERLLQAAPRSQVILGETRSVRIP